MSKSLIKLVDEAILPAFLIIGLKVISIAVINNLLSLYFYYQNFGRIYYAHANDAFTVNTYSDFIVYIGFLICIVFILIKLLYFSDAKADPAIVLKLAKANKIHFMQTSLELYHILFVWMIFFTGIVVYCIVRVITGIDSLFLLFPVLLFYLSIVWVVVKEVEKDVVKKLEFGKNHLV